MPEFEPSVPKHLVELKSPAEKHMVNKLSILTQQNQWQSGIIEEIHNRVGVIKDRVTTVETFQDRTEERFRTVDKLREQKNSFEEKKIKWAKLSVYIFFIILYPLYLLCMEKLVKAEGLSGFFKELIK